MISQPTPEAAPDVPENPPSTPAAPSPAQPLPPEFGGRPGPEPTRYGDWEKDGRCIDF
jgi:hypothetical protein